MHVLRGLRQAAAMVAAAALLSAAVGGLWAVTQDSGFRVPFAVSLMGAGLLSVAGGSPFARAEDNDARAFLGMGPERERSDSGGGLTGLGVFLFVSLPLCLVGLALFDLG